MRILWLSNAGWAKSGYATQTQVWVPRLTALGHDVAVVAFHGLQGAPLNVQGVQTFPGSTEDLFAQDLLPAYYAHHKADLLITLMDAWVLNPHLLRSMKVAHWMPIDAEASPTGMSAHLGAMDRTVLQEGGGQPIAMSQFGHGVLERAGFSPLYIPHGINCDVFKPSEDRDALRERLGVKDRFVIGINAANVDPVRKALPEQMQAFAIFREKHPDALLAIHSRLETRQGVNLERIAADLAIRDAVVFADQFTYCAGLVGDPDVAKWYNALDVLSNCSYGEGFGLPIVEAQACGTPVITTAFSSMPELTGAGWSVVYDPYWNRGHQAWWGRPNVRAIAAAYEDAYAKASGLREDARTFALEYDVAKVERDYWIPALKELEDL